jgi:putative ABC transport system permease protein
VKLRLVLKNLLRHPLRSLLTVGSLMVAIFLLLTLRSLVLTLSAPAEVASSKRLWVQSAVSLYVDLPISYPEKVRTVDGVAEVCRWQWFGGYYQDRDNYFGQFAVDAEELFTCFPELDISAGSAEGFLAKRTGCLVGRALTDKFGWQVGDRVPIIGELYPHPDGPLAAWEFEVAAIYDAEEANVDKRTFYFHWKYFEEMVASIDSMTLGVGTIVVLPQPGADIQRLMADIDRLLETPQRVQTTTESEFQAQFISMMGNVPFFVNSIGGGVLIAILLACVNTMLMAAREQTTDIGIMKALGFTDGSMFALLILQALVLCGLGGAMGIGLALALQGGTASVLGPMFPGYGVLPETIALGAGVTLAIGLIAGVFPAWRASRLRCVEALGVVE